MRPRRLVVLILAAAIVWSPAPSDARPKWNEMSDALLDIAREHRRSLESSMGKREREVRETSASLDRNTALYERGIITREELARAAREAGEARAQLEWARGEIVRATALIAEIEARKRAASLPSLRPGQYDTSGGLVRFAGHRRFALAQMAPLEQYFSSRAGRRLPVSAAGQTDFHTRLGFDHRNAVDVALHPDSAEGRLVMGWLREQGIPFMAFRGAREGAASGAHIHIGAPSERATTASVSLAPGRRARPEPKPRADESPSASVRSDASPRMSPSPPPTTQVLTR